MSREYAENRIREALRLAKGNAVRARRQVIAWTYEDAKLLHALALPHLAGIVAHAVGRVIAMGERAEAEPPPEPETPQAAREPELDQFGRDLLKELAKGSPPRFGQEGFAPPVHSTRASQRHVDVMRMLSEKGAKKKTKK